MSTWRRKAIACLPELKQEFERPDITPIEVFMELLPDRKETWEQFTIWILKDIYLDIRGLLIYRVGENFMKEKDRFYKLK